MRNLSDASKFIEQLESVIDKWTRRQSELFRSNVLNSSTFTHENLTYFELRNLTLKEQLVLGIISWYIPEEYGFILREDLRETKKYLNNEDECLVELTLESKGETLLWLLETSLWSNRDFFGNILKLNGYEKFFTVRKPKTKVRKPQRKRGYQDHGSRVEDHRWTPKSDYSLTALQFEIELRRESIEATRQVIRSLIT